MVQQGVGLAQHRHPCDRIRRARQAVVEHPQDVQVAPVQRLLDQPFGMASGADHGDIGRQVASPPPLGDQQPPHAMQRRQQAQRRHRPAAIGA
ncbi:hypothetical protein D3C73_892290 [compost metagenome]